jgi:hypothetical protein
MTTVAHFNFKQVPNNGNIASHRKKPIRSWGDALFVGDAAVWIGEARTLAPPVNE